VTIRAWGYLSWALVAGGFAVIQMGAVATRRWPTVAGVVRVLTRRRALQLVCLAGWLWLGWHFFVRSSR
jgi:Family of unknown function (DUF6186)